LRAETGTVTAKGDGTAKILAACEGKQAEASIKVVAPPPPPPPKVAPPPMPEPAAAEAATVILPTLRPEPPKPAPEKRAPEPEPVATPAVAETPVAVPDQEFEAEPRGKSKAMLFTVLAAVDVGLAWWMLGRLPVGPAVRLGATVFFAFGTVFWYTAQLATTWYQAHILAVALAFIAVNVTVISRQRAAHTGVEAIRLNQQNRTPP